MYKPPPLIIIKEILTYPFLTVSTHQKKF